MQYRISLALLISAALAQAQPAVPVKWAAIGNSITEGGYPQKLAALLGPGYQVENDGVSATTLLRNGDFPYWTRGKLAQVKAFRPDIISIKLGTNDSKNANWDTHKGDFKKDLNQLIDTLQAIPSKPQVWLVLPVPAFANSFTIRGAVIKDEIIPQIKEVAAARGLNVIDAHTPLEGKTTLFTDGVHMTAAGNDSIAAIFHRAYIAKTKRVACIGNSITEYAFGTAGTTPKDAYPIKLGNLLGRGHYAMNFGKSGAYMQKTSAMPYWNLGLIQKVIDFKPDIVTIKLGTNDSRQQAWNQERFITDYKSMIDTLSRINPKPEIWLCHPAPAWKRNGTWPFDGINDSIIKNHVIPAINQVARDKGLKTIDLYTPMASRESLVPDGVHPNAAGQDSLAHWVHSALTAPVVSVARSARPSPAYPAIDYSRGILKVTLPGNMAGTARLYSLDGRLEASFPLRAANGENLSPGESASLPLSGMAPGRYLLSVETPQGRAAKSLSIETSR